MRVRRRSSGLGLWRCPRIRRLLESVPRAGVMASWMSAMHAPPITNVLDAAELAAITSKLSRSRWASTAGAKSIMSSSFELSTMTCAALTSPTSSIVEALAKNIRNEAVVGPCRGAIAACAQTPYAVIAPLCRTCRLGNWQA